MDAYLNALPTKNWIDIISLAALAIQLASFILLIRYRMQTDAIQKVHIRNLLFGTFAGIGSLTLAIAINYFSYAASGYSKYTFPWYLYLIGAAIALYIPFAIASSPNDQERTLIEQELDLLEKSAAIRNRSTVAGSDEFGVSIRPQKTFTWQWNPATLNVDYDTQTIHITTGNEEKDITLHRSEIKKVKIISDAKSVKIASTQDNNYQINFATKGTSKQGRSLATAEEELHFQRFKKLWNAAYHG